ncbi:cell division protein SepF [Convivina praedatoris]|uniref:Cell division protein SepF n=1 Tax=Convivina praedatoris TaxID=2880963 RepID=A0ABN8HE29_9LACO|nr:cell division protein SepF [Convivina sp. LMG 32447]CAH1854358.1 Cell division protein SepF [Convivina sp. LMG 32447]CAH1855591.1 Cell division protein SepF [Convivina sp. LMG 32447]CAH1855672.1 Cell division protein SepF [Convivina sp. LMG 32447]
MAFDSIKRLFSSDDDYYEEEEFHEAPTQEVPAGAKSSSNNANRGKITNRDLATISSKIALFEPKVYSDSRAIASQVLGGEAVIVNFTQIDEGQAKRILDFLGGSVYAVDGEIERIGQSIFLVTPNTFEISGSLSDNLEPASRY